MFRPCPKCGTSNHISAHICQCGFQIIGTPQSEQPRPELERAASVPSAFRQQVFPTKSPDLPKQSSLRTSQESAQEMQKRAIREALLAEELQKSAGGKPKIKLKKSLVAVSLAILIGAMLAVLSGFTGINGSSKEGQDKNEQAPLTDKSLAPDSRYSAASNPAGKNSVEGEVVDVGSGDTITIADKNNREYKIKLEGIDAPELEQDFGPEAQKNLFTLIFGKTVQVILQKPGADGFTIGKVLLNGKNVSLEQLKAGLAWHDKNVALDQSDNDLYAQTETNPKRNGFGLWSAANPLPPWEYRNKSNNHTQNENQAVASETNGEVLKAVPNVELKPKTTIVQETGNTTESQTASIETAPSPAYIKSLPSIEPTPSIKSPTSVGISPPLPSRKVLTVVSTGYENKPTPISRTATTRCSDGTLSYSANQSEICAGHGGVANRLDGSIPPAKTSARGANKNPELPRLGDCFVFDGGKKVYLDRGMCGN